MKEVVLGLLGLGNIGGGVWDLIREFGEETAKRTGVRMRVKRALVLDKKIHGGKEVPEEVLTTDYRDILEDPEIDIVCEFLGGEHILARRAVGGENGPVGQKIYKIVDEMEKRAMAIGEDMRGGQPTPGNIAGGLSSIEEKSLGAIVKSGHRPIQGVLEYCDRADGKKGLWIKDSPGREPEILTGMAATGAQVMMFSTGRGAPQGFPSMPVIKICGNPNTYERMQHDMDLNAGRIITGEKTIEEVGEEAFALLLEVLNGKMTRNEALGYYGSMDIFCLGPVI